MQVRMKKARALAVFTVSYAGIRLKIRVLPHAKAVYTEYTEGCSWRMRAALPEGFFEAAGARARYTGTIVLAGNADLQDVVPHEVFHAVLYKMKTVSTDDDEQAAYAIGMLSARITKKVNRAIRR